MITDRENFFKVLDTASMPYGEVPVEWLIGQADDDRDKIVYRCPPPPMDVTKIDGYNLPRSEQYFRRQPIPKCWDRKVLDEIAMAQYSTGKTDIQRRKEEFTNFNWWRVYENMTPEMADYFDQECERRDRGYWFFNNGEATYLTGAHYMFIVHWWLKVGYYPTYKDRNLMDFYAWKSIEEDPSADGLLTPKHRRSNHTTISCFLGFEYVSRTPGSHFAIQSHGEKGAESNFQDKVVPGWRKLVPFFQPISSSGDNPKESIVMDNPSRLGSRKDRRHEGEEALESKIFFCAKGLTLDGDVMHRYVMDEGGKIENRDINLEWGINRRCLGDRGKAYFPSTRENVKEPYTDAWQTMYKNSLMSTAMDMGSRTTVSGMRALFIPCYVGHTLPKRINMFTDKFGNSVIHKPDAETKAWLLDNRCYPNDAADRAYWSEIYDEGGAFEFEVNERIKNKQDPAEKRRMPFTIEEVFATVNPACEFDTDMINTNKTKLASHYKGDKSWQDHLTVQVRLEYVGDIEKGDVYAVEDKKGAFLWNRKYLPVERTLVPGATKHKVDLNGDGGELALKLRIFANNVARSGPRQGMREKFGNVKPITDSGRDHESNTHILIGMDPQGLAQIDQRSKTLSKASSHGFYPYREEIDGEWTEEMEKDPKFAEDWVTHAFIFEYLHHPKEPEVHHSDMLKAAIFLNARILIEKQTSPQFIKYMRDRDCEGFLIRDKAWAKDKSKSVPGLASSQYVIKMYVDRLRSWIKRFCYPNKCPFPRTMEQWMQMDPGDMEKFDAGVSSGYALLAAQPGELRIPTKTNNLPQEEPKGQITLASVYNALRRR